MLLLLFIESGNTIVCDGWRGYGFFDILDRYNKDVHIRWGQDFGFGVNSTSYIGQYGVN